MYGVGAYHIGGLIGTAPVTRNVPMDLFAGAPRLHGGGKILKQNEVPIITEMGERVLTEKQDAEYQRLKRGAGGSGPVSLQVVLKNESNQPMQAKSSETQWSGDMKSAVITIMLDAVDRNVMGARDKLRG